MYEIEKSIGFLLAKAYQRAGALFKEELDPFGLTPRQFSLLAFLWQQDELSQVELSERSQIDRTTICGLIDRLEKQELVERRPNPHDRRSYLISLTPRGRELEEPLCAAADRTLARFTAGLSEHDQSYLVRHLEVLRGERRIYATLDT
ncbi:MAG: MarR family transcriptional regulator [Geobacter sp.]|nr:MarR family transcriptional regulator [Geobacter sp.]